MSKMWRRLVVLALVAATGTASAARPTGRPTTTPGALARVGFRRLSIAGARVREEPAHGEGAFVVPNEVARVFAKVIAGRARSGGVLAIGSLRGVEDAVTALDGVDDLPEGFRLIQLDRDPGVTRFNLEHLRALASRASRESIREGLRGMVIGRHGTFADHLGALESVPEENARTVLGDATRFARARTLARAGRIVPVNGDLAGTRTLRELGRALRARGEKLSVIDLSNAPEYVGDGGLDRLAQNLTALPLSDDAIVLFTVASEWGVGRPVSVAGAYPFSYFAVHARDLVAAIERTPGKYRWTHIAEAALRSARRDADGLYVVPPGALR